MAWIYVVLAGLMEIGLAVGLKASQGWTRPVPGLLGLTAASASLVTLTFALTTLPVGTAYSVWVGIGAVGVSLYGFFALSESLSPAKIFCLALILAGVVGLRIFEGQ